MGAVYKTVNGVVCPSKSNCIKVALDWNVGSMNGLEEFANATVEYVQALPLQSFLPYDKRNRTGYHACMIIFYQLLRALTRFEKQLYLEVDHSFNNNNVAALPNDNDIDPFASDSDDESIPPILSLEQEAELRMRYLTASARKLAGIWNRYTTNVKRAWSNRARAMNALPVHGMYMSNSIPIDNNNVNSFLTQSVYEDSTHLFSTIKTAVKKDLFQTQFYAVAMLDLVQILYKLVQLCIRRMLLFHQR